MAKKLVSRSNFVRWAFFDPDISCKEDLLEKIDGMTLNSLNSKLSQVRKELITSGHFNDDDLRRLKKKNRQGRSKQESWADIATRIAEETRELDQQEEVE